VSAAAIKSSWITLPAASEAMTIVEITEWVKVMETGAAKQQPSSRITNLSGALWMPSKFLKAQILHSASKQSFLRQT
jgi:hypothetical protein